MLVTIMGKYSKPYSIEGKSGISYRVSAYLGNYESDDFSGAVGVGEHYDEYRISPEDFELVRAGEEYDVDIENSKQGKAKIKSIRSIIKLDDGRTAFVPLS